MPRITVAPHTPALAADFNAVSDQSIMTFGTAAQRSAAIPTPTEGMHTYRTDAKVVEYWDGAQWVLRPRARWGKVPPGTLADGGGNVHVTHGLGVVPTWVSVTPNDVGDITSNAVINLVVGGTLNATSFYVSVYDVRSASAIPGQGVSFYWEARA